MDEPAVVEYVCACSDAIKLPVHNTATVRLFRTTLVVLVRVRLVDFLQRVHTLLCPRSEFHIDFVMSQFLL
jgi:hypothetical protein